MGRALQEIATNFSQGIDNLAGAIKENTSISQYQKRRMARDAGGIPRSASPTRQGVSKNGTRWWEYKDAQGKTKIVVEHKDGSVHVGTPKPQSEHGTTPGAEPKYYEEPGTGHVGESKSGP